MKESFFPAREGAREAESPKLIGDGLQKMLSLIEQGWCQAAPAEDADGRLVFASSPRAVRWCLAGAARVAAQDDHRIAMLLLKAIWAALPPTKRPKLYQDIARWNDARDRTQAEVVEAIKTAMIPELPDSARSSENA